ncbi:MAG: ATP-dependent endonuclease [Rhodospirillaceae bacterium]|nr:ATP-dependent endonuclease [Rhodospirillaceae bacterium]
MLVEGISDQIAVETLAGRQARDLAKEGVAVVPIGGAHSVSKFLARFGPKGIGLHVSGLCDAAEERLFCRELARAGLRAARYAQRTRKRGLLRLRPRPGRRTNSRGRPDAIEAILAQERDLASFRTLQKQAAWRDACFVDQLRRFLGAGARRKLRYASLFVLALDLDRQPRPLRDILSRA